MAINLSVPRTESDLKPRITVVGVGGAGGNAVNNMIRSNLEGVDFLVTNTDAQALAQSQAERKIQLGVGITRGLGAGARPEVGREAAEEVRGEIVDHLDGSTMVFITAGMGGGTGPGAAPVIARAAREHGILTVGVVTKPFHFEGTHRMRIAEQGIEELAQFVDTLIIIPNQNLFRVATEKTTFAEAFKLADDVLYSGVRGVTDLMIMPGLINLDFADIRSIMTEMGKAMMGTGEADGEKRAVAAAEAAISNPLLDDVSMKGARGVLINITGGPDMTLYEVDEAANRIREEVDADANIIFGATLDETLDGRIRISMVATGIEAAAAAQPRPLSLVGSPKPVAARPALAAARAMPVSIGNTAVAMAAEPRAEAAMAAAPLGAALLEDEPAGDAYDPARTLAEAADLGLEAAAETPVEPAPAPLSAPAPAPAAARPARPALSPAGHPLARPAAQGPAQAPARPAMQPLGAKPAPRTVAAAPAPQPAKAADAPFIAPPPAEAMEMRGMFARRQAAAADPYAEAAMANGGREPARAEPRDRPSGLDLFKRVTGLGGLRRGQPLAKAETPAAEPAAAKPAPRQEPTIKPPARPASPIGGLNPADRTLTSRQEDDLLDIPSFLRRQAN
ncbi:MAG: cell division protein FtsZ [Rhodospirillales bacterium]